MEAIVKRLIDKKSLDLAKSILESHGYTVSKRVDEAYKDEYVKVANSTSRSAGMSAIDKGGNIRSVTAKYIMDNINKDASILDFGAGKSAIQAQALKEKGFTNVTAYDFGSNTREGLHDPDALSRTYDVVFASNVINVSSDEEMIRDTLEDMWGAVRSGGILVFNYPSRPRKAGLSTRELHDIVVDELGQIPKVVASTNSTPVWRIDK